MKSVILVLFCILLLNRSVFATYDLSDGELPLERFQIVHSGNGNGVKNSETKTDHHIPDSANFPPRNYYHYRSK
ncbi:hypothetical protein CRE_22573 [Caenorhabditis remanei]|uniref:Uncharacterized protein n=1 Tax=Caenorhabditis remanei TaxID=31234 RepID=E3N396_CAERE|nr:hypothetical protein CRE_22573 [Caenorhabditis remanei]